MLGGLDSNSQKQTEGPCLKIQNYQYETDQVALETSL